MRPKANCSTYPDQETLSAHTLDQMQKLGEAFARYVESRRPQGCSYRAVEAWLKSKGHKVSEPTLRNIRDCRHIKSKTTVKYRYKKRQNENTLQALLSIPDIPAEMREAIHALLTPAAPWVPKIDAANMNTEPRGAA